MKNILKYPFYLFYSFGVLIGWIIKFFGFVLSAIWSGIERVLE